MINIFMICSKQFTDLNLRLFAHSVKNCCKTLETNFTIEDMEKYGPNVFSMQHEIAKRRHTLVYDNNLPAACKYCIDAEPNSMRAVWNTWNEPTSNDEREVILESDWIQYIEIVNSTACDLACIYCNAENSTTWAKEMGVPITRADSVWKQKLLETFYLYLENKDYSLIPHITFAFSGGEPTYDNETFELIKNIVKRVDNKTKIIIQMTSNFNTKPKQMEKFVNLMKEYPAIDWYWVASIDDIHERNDAIRFHSKFDLIETNIKKIYACPNVTIIMLPSINVFSLPFLSEYILYYSQLLGHSEYCNRWNFGQNVITGPEYLSPFMLDKSFTSGIDNAIELSKALGIKKSTDDSHVKWIKHLENLKENLGSYDEEKWWRILHGFAFQRAEARNGININDTFPHVYNKIESIIRK